MLGFADPDDRYRSIPRQRRCSTATSDEAGLRCVAVEIPRPPAHVVESAAVGARAATSTSLRPPRAGEEEDGEQKPLAERIDDGTRGLSYLYGQGGGRRLELCTESLGFESCCDGRMGAEEERAEQEIRRRIEEANGWSPGGQRGDGAPRRKARPARRRAEKREFPPPLTWLREEGGGDSAGRCRSFLKAVRKDGRFLLTEVRIERPEVLRASRQGGRLRLELVEPERKETEEAGELGEEAVAEKALGVEDGGAVAEEAVMVAEEEEQRWRMPAAKALEGRIGGGGGGFMSGSCQELAREGLPSSPFWGSRFLTTA